MSNQPQRKSALAELIDNEEEQSTWIVTYADMMTLLLVFFVLMYSVYYIDTEKFKAAVTAIEVKDSKTGTTMTVMEYAQLQQGEKDVVLEQVLGLVMPEQVSIQEELQSILDASHLSEKVSSVVDGDKILLQIPGELLFSSGKAELLNGSTALFDEVNQLFSKHADYSISIRGHTDNQPITTAAFASNWELSAVRATTVLKYFISQGVEPARMTATGYADLMPIASNDTAEGRATNRRVEFVLEKAK